MTLLASQIPILYCMMYFQSHRQRSSRNYPTSPGTSLLLQALNPRSRWARSPSGHLDNSEERVIDGGEIQRHLTDRFQFQDDPSSNQDLSQIQRSWMWHKGDTDPRNLCLSKYNLDSSHTRRLSSSDRRGAGGTFKNNGVSDSNCPTKTSPTNQMADVRDQMHDRLMTVEELQSLIPEVARSRHRESNQPARRYKADDTTHADMKLFNDSHCGICYTEIGYEVLTHIQDVQGLNHTVINFRDAYQFIPAGRCLNENSPCGVRGAGGGGARCVQVYRAQWTMVWAPTVGQGTRLVAHEVPSHCQCLNVGRDPALPPPPLVDSSRLKQQRMDSDTASLDSLSSSRLESNQKLGIH